MANKEIKPYKMKKIYTIWVLTLAILTSQAGFSQSISWNGFTTGASSYSTTNAGLTMSVTASGSGSQSGYPSYSSANGGSLSLGVDWSNKTSNVKYTITFSKPLVAVMFLLYDVDQSSSWDDKVTIAGVDNNNATVYPTYTASTYNAAAANGVLEGTSNNSTYANNPAVVSFGGSTIKSLTITYSAGSSSPSNPSVQYMGIGNITYGAVLPVDLISFSADRRNGDAGLKWEAENMINFSRFEIERSATGAGGFETVDTVFTNGVDHGFFSASDKNVQGRMNRAYYRLKMVDLDGKFKYSQVIMVAFDETAIDVRPTILQAGQPVNVKTSGTTRYDIRLFDMSGRVMQQLNQVSGQAQLETSRLNRGIYIVVVSNGTTKESFRFTVQ